MRKKLLLSTFALAGILSSCGGGGGANIEGDYTLLGSVEQNGKAEVLRVIKDTDGNVVKAFIPTDGDTPINIKLTKSYSGTSQEPQKMYLKKVYAVTNGRTVEIPVSPVEITTSGTTVSLQIPYAEKKNLPFLLGNALEDTAVYYHGSYTLAKESDNWVEETKTYTYTGGNYTLSGLGEIKDLSVSFDNVTCAVSGNSFQSPCSGTVDFNSGNITVSIDDSYLQTDHSKTETVSTASYGTILSAKVVAGSVTVSGSGISLTDDGSGDLTGTGGNGTIDYATGQLTLTDLKLPTSSQEVNKSQWVGYEDNGTLQLPQNLKPLTIRLEVTNSTDINDENLQIIATCSDDGAGNLIGACSGTVDYANGTVSYNWDDSITDGANVKVSYTYTETTIQPTDLTITWKTEDKNLSLKLSYKKLSSKAKKVYYFSTPGEVSSVKIFDGNSEVSGVNITTYPQEYGELVKVELPDFPKSDLTADYVSQRVFNFNPSVTVSGSERYQVPVTLKVEAELETGRKLKLDLPVVIDCFTSYISSIQSQNNQDNNQSQEQEPQPAE